MWLKQNRTHVQFSATRVAKALKIVIYCSLHRQLERFVLGTANIFDDILRC
jgi:hypothetical protein